MKYLILNGQACSERYVFPSTKGVRSFICMTFILTLHFPGAMAEDNKPIPLDRPALENIYICAAVAHKLNASDADAQDIIIAGFERAVPSIEAISGELHVLAKRRVEAMTTVKDLRAFDHGYCERPAIIYMGDGTAS